MEAARLLAQRGHRVTLVERERELGGQLRLAARAPVFQNVETDPAVLLRLVAFQARQLAAAAVEVRLGQAVTTDLVDELRAEVVVLATGASYRGGLGLVIRRLLGSRWGRARAVERLLGHPAVKRLFYTRLRRPNAALEQPLRARGVDVHRIGDCQRPGKTPEAMLDATRLAYRL